MAANYDVIGQRQTFEPDAAGRFQQAVEITIKTKPSGVVRFHTFTLDEARAPNVVAQVLSDLADTAETLHTL